MSQAHIKLEQYGYAVADTTKAIEIDNNYAKVSQTYSCAQRI